MQYQTVVAGDRRTGQTVAGGVAEGGVVSGCVLQDAARYRTSQYALERAREIRHGHSPDHLRTRYWKGIPDPSSGRVLPDMLILSEPPGIRLFAKCPGHHLAPRTGVCNRHHFVAFALNRSLHARVLP